MVNHQYKEKIKAQAAKNRQWVIDVRRHLHAHPELSFQELNTAKFVANALRNASITVQEGIAKTGLCALIKGKNHDKKIVALRADMDALPIQETNDVPYVSQTPGVMHACGHDAHTASLMGTAKILNALKNEFEGTVKLIFQPGEEKNPGGAALMIKAGILKNPTPRYILGQHVTNFLPVGKVGFTEGMAMASADEIDATILGKGGHAAAPHQTVDPIVIAAHIIVALQQIISRNCHPQTPSVLSFGKIIGGEATNVIPDKVKIVGTFRTMDAQWRKAAHQKMKAMAQGVAKAMGGRCTFNIDIGYPCLKNNVSLTRFVKQAAVEFLGQENVVDLDSSMGAEDFAYYAQAIDACFYRLGTGNQAKGITLGGHMPTFDIDEEALHIGAGFMAWSALKRLSSN